MLALLQVLDLELLLVSLRTGHNLELANWRSQRCSPLVSQRFILEHWLKIERVEKRSFVQTLPPGAMSIQVENCLPLLNFLHFSSVDLLFKNSVGFVVYVQGVEFLDLLVNFGLRGHYEFLIEDQLVKMLKFKLIGLNFRKVQLRPFYFLLKLRLYLNAFERIGFCISVIRF